MSLRSKSLSLCLAIAVSVSLRAADTTWTGATNNNFFDAGNWSAGAPGSTDDHAFIDGGANLPATIAANTGTVQLGAFSLGSLDAGGHVIQNGGTLVVLGDDIGQESQIGDTSEESSSWIMNGNATILYDDPLGEGGLDTDGTGKDFDVGKSTPEGAVGRLEMHDDSILRISDDLKIADGDGGHGEVFLDGNAQLTVGSGISASGVTSIVVAGNSLLATGNSAGPGSPLGSTDEGYLTLSTGGGESATVEIRDSGRLYARTLQQRGGESSITVRNSGEFHIFDLFEHELPNLGTATVVDSTSGPARTSHVSSGEDSVTTITLLDDAIMTVDSDLEDSGWSGLALSGGTNSGGNAGGGITVLEIADNATFLIQQDLHMTIGTGEFAESTLKVSGGGATINIGGDLRMALDDFEEENLGTATLHAELTSNSHSTVVVAGEAIIGNGNLLVTFGGYSPTGGESYSLLTASKVTGSQFRDVTLPQLADGLSWDLIVGADSVVLNILGGGLLGDFNGNGTLDVGDIDMLTVQSAMASTDTKFDLNSDGAVNKDDVTIWAKDLANTWIGDSNLDGQFNSGDFVQVFSKAKFEQDVDATWSDGDWNGDGRFNSGDFVLAFSDAGYEKGERPAAVPEVMPLSGVVIGLLIGTMRVRRNDQ
ncbi:MAG: hypothetical protein KDB27_07685 [Planctomycetales bacterium]|nr:hypothetical protein [Planctomycetales bacterium]